MDKNSIRDMAQQLGFDVSDDSIKKATSMDDRQMMEEMKKMKEKIKADPQAYKKQKEAIEALAVLMNREQREKLDRLMAFLEE